jgi:hypothetical protein
MTANLEIDCQDMEVGVRFTRLDWYFDGCFLGGSILRLILESGNSA